MHDDIIKKRMAAALRALEEEGEALASLLPAEHTERVKAAREGLKHVRAPRLLAERSLYRMEYAAELVKAARATLEEEREGCPET